MASDDDLYELHAKNAVEKAGRAGFDIGREVGRNEGRNEGIVDGIELGKALGFVAGVQSVAAALSDGTRKGSSMCAKALESLKRLGALEEEK
ncbi:hypothetical protein [Pseudomonas sp. Marseille-Q5115]|uniref:hypothetical protein n=1 Tax=Pseudomonas sp. Marseille-Q5115 TaxID=2866593 RepID=UPI001CE47C92|nr:hypothetical protein [Pseudomonas sp. Marseille-Q5115]